MRKPVRPLLRRYGPGSFAPFAIALVAGVSVACGAPPRTSTVAPTSSVPVAAATGLAGGASVFDRAPQSEFPAVRDGLIAEWLRQTPSWGRELGFHEYDGKVADYSWAGIQSKIAQAKKAKETLAAFDVRALGTDDALDLEIAKQTIDFELFRLVDLDRARKVPQFYEELFSVNSYVDREYAPLDVRGARLVDHEEAALRAVPRIYENLVPPLSRVVAEVAAKNYAGYASYLRGEVAKVFRNVGDAELRGRFAKSNEALAKEADKFAEWLRSQAVKGDESHVLGPERYRKLLSVQERLEMPLSAFKRLGEENLAKNKAAFEALAKTVKLQRPKASELIPLATRIMNDARKFIVEKNLVTLPSDDTAVVKETPPYARWNAASIEASGPFDPFKTAFYYITLPDPSWPKKEQDEYVLSRGSLIATTVHEVYPGHFLQGRWVERAPSKLQKMAGTYSFVEGWAHYVEEMMIEQGFEPNDQARLGQLEDALLRNCRFVVSLGLHTEGMTVEQGETRFMNDCHVSRASAREQAIRGTFDPGYFAYTLGKLQILALREEAKGLLGQRFSLQRFHDALLSHGSPPVALIRQRVLAELTK